MDKNKGEVYWNEYEHRSNNEHYTG